MNVVDVQMFSSASKAAPKSAGKPAAKKASSKKVVAAKVGKKPVAAKQQGPATRPAVAAWDRKPPKKGQTVSLRVPAPKEFACTPLLSPEHERPS